MIKNYAGCLLTCFSISFLIILSGCIATSDEVASLKEEIITLKNEISILKQNQTELNLQMKQLNTNLQIYTEKLEESKYKMSLLAQRMDDVHSSLSQRMDILSRQLPKVDISVVPLPTELFNISYNDYSRGMYDLAIRGFKDYLAKYPDSELTNRVYYYLADSYFAKKQYYECIKIIDEYLTKYQKDDYYVSMLYQKALCLQHLGETKKAEELFQYIKTQYPNSKEAQNLKTE
ncbi:MAG: tetratricopeptide repeat protein [Endomicrobia bacterium]|nr:tetratricopeptide repeat protein [Endomicrobiia bacterium]MCX7941310.1 tetratricopeptide repeat protein [Endomicrobiia bacterium]MDW8055956.1 tetratricopeptide repeat protein [Elusimicrobiota bacterium]